MNNNKLKLIIPVFITIIFMYLMIYLDVWLRARHSYLEGEKYLYWYEHPEAKITALKEKYEKEKKKLDEKLSKMKISREDYDREIEILNFNQEREMEENPIKYAYVWFQTTVELFSPPESKWVKLARKKLPIAKSLWQKELESKGIKVEPYMLE